MVFVMGEQLDPRQGALPVNLPQAKEIIDLLSVLEEKTKGNLTPEEEGSLKQAISELGEVYIARVQQFQEETIRQAGQNLNLH